MQHPSSQRSRSGWNRSCSHLRRGCVVTGHRTGSARSYVRIPARQPPKPVPAEPASPGAPIGPGATAASRPLFMIRHAPADGSNPKDAAVDGGAPARSAARSRASPVSGMGVRSSACAESIQLMRAVPLARTALVLPGGCRGGRGTPGPQPVGCLPRMDLHHIDVTARPDRHDGSTASRDLSARVPRLASTHGGN